MNVNPPNRNTPSPFTFNTFKLPDFNKKKSSVAFTDFTSKLPENFELPVPLIVLELGGFTFEPTAVRGGIYYNNDDDEFYAGKNN